MRFIKAQNKCISRLVRILGNYYLEDIFGSQVTIAILRPLRFHRIRFAILKKPVRKDQRSPNNYGMKYGTRFPRNATKAAQFDKENGNLL